MDMNFFILGLAALVPLVMGFLWYGPILFQKAWMKQMGFTEESMQGSNMGLIFFLCFVFSFLLALALQPIVIHQWGMFSTLAGEPEFMDQTGEAYTYYQDFMAKYGDRFRTFKHGALHGALTGIFITLPVLATQAMFEKKTAKYVLINAGYWIVTIALMGGIICQWA